MVFRQHVNGVKIEFVDIVVKLDPDKQSATVDLTGKATMSGEHDFSVQEFKFLLKKVGRDWLIYRVETVKTLSRALIPVCQVSSVRCQVKALREATAPDT